MAVSVRVIKSLDDLQATTPMQREIWGFSETDIVPPRLMAVATHVGGLMLGAYDGGRMVGFSMALPGVKPDGRAYWHSHMTGVLPEYQNQGIGRSIKLRQREEAQRNRIELVEWTFDPLEIRNSHFNLERLGVVAGQFVPNQYGVTSSALHGGLPTDRLVAEWYVNGPRARAIVDRGETLDRRVAAEIEVPKEIAEWRRGDPPRALEVQGRIRQQFQKLLGQGLGVVGYRRSGTGGVFELGRLEDQPVSVV